MRTAPPGAPGPSVAPGAAPAPPPLAGPDWNPARAAILSRTKGTEPEAAAHGARSDGEEPLTPAPGSAPCWRGGASGGDWGTWGREGFGVVRGLGGAGRGIRGGNGDPEGWEWRCLEGGSEKEMDTMRM